MPNQSGRENGFDWDAANARLDVWYGGARVGSFTATVATAVGALVAETTLTAATGLTVTTGNSVNSAGDERVTVGNLRLGVVSAFGTTEPTSAVVMKAGTAPVGAIATSGGVFSSTTVVRKIIAAGTASNVQT